MNDSELTKILNLSQNKPIPALPGAFQQGVLREIRRRSSEAAAQPPRWLALLFEPVRHLRFAAAIVAFAGFLGTMFGTYETRSPSRVASQALDLEVFTSRSPSLPSTLIHP